MPAGPSPRLPRSRKALVLGMAVAASLSACENSARSSAGNGAGAPPARCTGDTVDAWVSDRRYCLTVFASGLGEARQMAFAPNGDLFVNNASVTVLFDITGFEPIVGERGPDGALRQGLWSARPVDVREGPDGALYFSDDLGGRVFKLGYAN